MPQKGKQKRSLRKNRNTGFKILSCSVTTNCILKSEWSVLLSSLKMHERTLSEMPQRVNLKAFVLCHTPAHIPSVCKSPCMQLLHHVVYSSCTIPYSPATLPVAPLNDQGVEWLSQQHLVATMPTIAPAFFLRSEGNEMVIAHFSCLYLA